jgi:uncharacterized protein YecE (DUF72 family)
MPKAENLTKIITAGGPNLSYSIKAHQSLTHKIENGNWEREAETYINAIEPLAASGRLEAVLFQFPYSFHYTPENRAYLDKLFKFFKNIPKAVEFRTADWCTAKVIDAMKSREIPLVSLDLPDLPKLPPIMEVVTSSMAYIRLHGRNKQAWWGKDDHARYDYLYSDSEIEAWAGRIERIAEQAQRILVYFNNHPFGKAARNAKRLGHILEKMGLLLKQNEDPEKTNERTLDNPS